jgi:hypothetical protein
LQSISGGKAYLSCQAWRWDSPNTSILRAHRKYLASMEEFTSNWMPAVLQLVSGPMMLVSSTTE